MLLITRGRNQVAHNTACPGHGAEPRFSRCFPGRWHNFRDGHAKAGDSDWPVSLADALEDRETGRFKFRNRDFVRVYQGFTIVNPIEA